MEEAAVVAEEDAVEAAVGGVAGPGLKLLLLCGGGGPWLLLLRVSSAKRGPWTGGLMGEYRVIRSSGSKQGVQSKSRDVKYRFFFQSSSYRFGSAESPQTLDSACPPLFSSTGATFYCTVLITVETEGERDTFRPFCFCPDEGEFFEWRFHCLARATGNMRLLVRYAKSNRSQF